MPRHRPGVLRRPLTRIRQERLSKTLRRTPAQHHCADGFSRRRHRVSVQTCVQTTVEYEGIDFDPTPPVETAVNRAATKLFDAFPLGDAPFRDMGTTSLGGSDGSKADEREHLVERDAIAPLLLTVPEAARVLAIGRTTLYELISSGAIEAVHIGRAIRIPVASARAFVEDRRPSH